MNPAPLIVARYLATHDTPQAMIIDGKPGFSGLPSVDEITAFCWSEFNQVPSEAVARKVHQALRAVGIKESGGVYPERNRRCPRRDSLCCRPKFSIEKGDTIMRKAGTVLKHAAPEYIRQHASHLRKGIAETLDAVLAVAETFNTEAAAAVADQNLSTQGVATGLSRVAKSALAKLNAVETIKIKNLTDRAASLEKSLLDRATYAPPTDPLERITHELRLQEIRGQLRELSASERLNVYLTTSDPLTLAAIESAPLTLSAKRPDGSRRLEPFIDPEQRTAAVLARAERTDSATVNTLREVQSLREVYTLAVNSVRQEILDGVQSAASEREPTIVHTGGRHVA